MTAEKVELGEKLFNDDRFSTTGDVSCATCHAVGKAFTDSPLRVSEGVEKLTGTRNAPTILNAAFNSSQFWDGREPDLESQSQQPFVNPVEMALPDHEPILEVVRADPDYIEMFRNVFEVEPEKVTMDHVSKAIATFERTVVSGNSPFDRYFYGGEEDALTAAQKRGLELFMNEGRCVSCHTITETHALFTDGKFYNLNVSFEKISSGVDELAKDYLEKKAAGADVDIKALTDVSASELGRYAVSEEFRDIGAFKTPTLRNIALTAPYMHDGSHATLQDVVVFYNLGGRVTEDDPINPFQSGGIRPLNLTDQEVADIVAFLESLTSPTVQAQLEKKPGLFERLIGNDDE
jgi:cytochrome c peroxidase